MKVSAYLCLAFGILCGCDGGDGTGSGGQGGGTATPECGNGIVEQGEECDGDVGSLTCADVNPELETGTVTCDASCKVDSSGCSHTPVLTDGTLVNTADCTVDAVSYVPSSGKSLAAVRFTPESYPFVAKTVRYHLKKGFQQLSPTLIYCATGYQHRVRVSVTSEQSPPAQPGSELVVTVPPFNDSVDGSNELTVALPEEVTVNEGEHLVVGVELVTIPEGGGDVTALCLRACENAGGEAANFWSDAENPPFSYAAVPERFSVEVDGTFVD